MGGEGVGVGKGSAYLVYQKIDLLLNREFSVKDNEFFPPQLATAAMYMVPNLAQELLGADFNLVSLSKVDEFVKQYLGSLLFP